MLRSLSIYLAWVFVLMLLGGMSLAWLVLFLVAPVERAFPAMSQYSYALAVAITALVAIVIPALRWRTQGLLPDTMTAEHQARLVRGERAIAIGHTLLLVGTVAPWVAVVVLQNSEYAVMALYAGSFWTLPLCFLLWGIGLYLVVAAGRRP